MNANWQYKNKFLERGKLKICQIKGNGRHVAAESVNGEKRFWNTDFSRKQENITNWTTFPDINVWQKNKKQCIIATWNFVVFISVLTITILFVYGRSKLTKQLLRLSDASTNVNVYKDTTKVQLMEENIFRCVQTYWRSYTEW